MRKFIVSLASVLFILSFTFALAAPPSNTLPQFTSGGHVLGFAPNKAYIAGMGHALTEEFINPNMVTPKPLSSDKVVYENLWKGINLTYEARRTDIAESTYTVSPGSDVNNIRIRYNADVTIQKNGTLSFNHPTSKGSYTMSAPKAWQEKHGTKIPVKVAYTRLSDTTIGFTTGPYDTTHPLIIDPVYKWHSFYGSGSNDYGAGIALDTSGNVYVTGGSSVTWGSPLNPHGGNGNSDIVILKLNNSGVYQWHTFYGSNSGDSGSGIALDTSGNVYVTGDSWATWGSPLNPHSGGGDTVILKLNSSGTYQWHTFYGSSDYEYGSGIALDTSGNVYVTGRSYATWGLPINPYSGGSDIVALKLNNSGVYQWHTFYGSGSDDYGYGIAVDTGGNIYVTGDSSATWGSPLNPYSGGGDIVILKLNSSGVYQWHTFYGSASYDYGAGIALDTNGNVYVTGDSSATWGLPINPYSGGSDIVALKLNGSGAYQWHTFHGSGSGDFGYGIAVDTTSNVYVTGESYVTWGLPINPYTGDSDIVVLKVSEVLSPPEGTIGTKVTIHGTGFGDKKGKVLINGTAAKIAKNGWSPDQITCTISKPPLPVNVAHPVSVVVDKVPRTLDDTFTIRLPALDDLSVTSGAYLDPPIRVTGRFFGAKKGKAYLYNPSTEKKKNLKVADWRMNESTGVSELTFVVPKTSKSLPAGTYQLQISNKVGPATTTPDFELLDSVP